MGLFSTISHGVSHGFHKVTSHGFGGFTRSGFGSIGKFGHGIGGIGGGIFSGHLPVKSPPFVGGVVHDAGRVASSVGHAASGAVREVKSQVNLVKGLETSVAGGIKGLSGLLSSPVFMIAAAGVVALVVLK